MKHTRSGFVALAALAISCTAEQRDEQPRLAPQSSDTSFDTAAALTVQPPRLGHDEADAPPGLDACTIARHVSKALDTLRRWPRTVIAGGRDECVLALLDSLGDRFIESGDVGYLAVLDSIHAVDDGYVAEYVPDVAARMARARFADVFTYLFERRASSPPLEYALAEGIQANGAAGRDSVALRSSWLSIAREALPAAALDTERRAYVDALLQRGLLVR